MNRFFKRKWLSHCCFWIGYSFYFFVVNALGNSRLNLGASFITVFYCAIIFYAIYLILKYVYDRGHILGTTVLMIGFYLLSGIFVYYELYGKFGLEIINNKYVVVHHAFSWTKYSQTFLVMHSNYTVMAVGYYYYKSKLRESTDKLEAVKARLNAESSMKSFQYTTLSAQVHPHMMANIFSHLKNKVDPYDRKLGMQLEEIYRLMKFYMEAHQVEGATHILLADEVKALEQYLSIQEEVEPNPFYINVCCSGNLMRFSTAPTLLQTLAGNLFKHADLWDKDHPAKIDILVGNTGYRIMVQNKKRSGPQMMPSHDVGLRNVRTRMEYLFGTDFSMEEKQDAEHYELTLCVQRYK
ncbi:MULTISPECIES: histidine kinase [Sphingobacterium]|uniref:Predicted signal transduction protein with a C-terminal ATPase domain n=1 Tax=Sphingobacterium multivorum TaxID=28454 RepID=A0A2X2J9H1_SPHMU|nr:MULTISPECIES: histidine kinase [Sphingobacterium]QRQ61258.1 histidine kinase [Sphingobacterium multivorum]SPZ88576.1 Predicted signal transduction protein with a C-terminal ATPase domain [Sphingobacterium multivorum]